MYNNIPKRPKIEPVKKLTSHIRITNGPASRARFVQSYDRPNANVTELQTVVRYFDIYDESSDPDDTTQFDSLFVVQNQFCHSMPNERERVSVSVKSPGKTEKYIYDAVSR